MDRLNVEWSQTAGKDLENIIDYIFQDDKFQLHYSLF